MATLVVGLPGALASPRVHAAESPAYHLKRLKNSRGGRTSLAQAARGDRLVVVVMKGAWCKVCVGQLARLADLRDRLRELGSRVVGISTDPVSENRRAAEEAKLPFEILSDEDHRVVEALGLWRSSYGHPMPAIVVIDRCGRERGRLLGRRPGQRPEASLVTLLEKIDGEPERCNSA